MVLTFPDHFFLNDKVGKNLMKKKSVKNNLLLLWITVILMVPAASQAGDSDQDSFPNEAIAQNMLDVTTDTTENETETNTMNIEVGDTVLTATLVDNSSAEALKEALSEAPITVDMRDYGNMEKVGGLGREFPTNDEPITAESGDIILFRGNALVIYYASNSWNFTRLGKIDNVTAEELKNILGEGNVTVTLSLPQD